MASSRKKINKGFIVLSRGERIAVINLLSVIVILLGFSIFRPMMHFSKKDHMAFHNLDSLIAIQEAAAAAQKKSAVESPIKPVDQPHTKPIVKPTKKKTTETFIEPQKTKEKLDLVLDINEADSTELVALPQIGEVMASRIHRYRNRLGGYVSLEQLFEVKGMDSSRFEVIKPMIRLGNHSLTKINVNRDEFKTLLRHPYLEYEQVKAIVNHRERKGLIKNWPQLCEIIGNEHPLLEHYVTY